MSEAELTFNCNYFGSCSMKYFWRKENIIGAVVDLRDEYLAATYRRFSEIRMYCIYHSSLPKVYVQYTFLFSIYCFVELKSTPLVSYLHRNVHSAVSNSMFFGKNDFFLYVWPDAFAMSSGAPCIIRPESVKLKVIAVARDFCELYDVCVSIICLWSSIKRIA